MKLIATKKHTREFQNNIALKVGDVVSIDSTRGLHWLGDVFCTLPDGSSGWVTRQAFENLEGEEARVKQNYCSVELETEIGDILEGYASTQTATWCSNTRGQSGWVSHEGYEFDKLEHKRRVDKLVTDIEIAFLDVRKGEGIGFREARQSDATYSNDEAAIQRIWDARAEDIERWYELSNDFIHENGLQVYLWTDQEGFYFMLPALMRCALRDIEVFDNSWFCNFVILDISYAASSIGFIDRFTKPQIFCLAQFCAISLENGIHSFSESSIWLRNYTQSLLELVGESLSPEWFKAPLDP